MSTPELRSVAEDAPVFVISGTLLALAILAGLTQGQFRAFGAPSR